MKTGSGSCFKDGDQPASRVTCHPTLVLGFIVSLQNLGERVPAENTQEMQLVDVWTLSVQVRSRRQHKSVFINLQQIHCYTQCITCV